MSRKTKLFSLVSLCLVCLFGLGLFVTNRILTQAAPVRQSETTTLMKTTQEHASSSYWTSERMQSALPAETLLEDLPAWQDEQPTGRDEQIWLSPDSDTTLLAESIPLDEYATFPYSTVGKVFFTDSRTGGNYVCSGTAVESANGSTVDTAAHCVMEGGSGDGYYTNWIFCPQYVDGTCPAASWSARSVVVSRSWAYNGDLALDLAAVVVEELDGLTLTEVVGGVGFGANLSRNQEFLALGYPAASPFDGERLQSCTGTTINYPGGNPRPIGIDCDMTGGSSGGGWLISVDGEWYVNGHNDFGSDAYPGIMWSPYFGTQAFAIFNAAQSA